MHASTDTSGDVFQQAQLQPSLSLGSGLGEERLHLAAPVPERLACHSSADQSSPPAAASGPTIAAGHNAGRLHRRSSSDLIELDDSPPLQPAAAAQQQTAEDDLITFTSPERCVFSVESVASGCCSAISSHPVSCVHVYALALCSTPLAVPGQRSANAVAAGSSGADHVPVSHSDPSGPMPAHLTLGSAAVPSPPPLTSSSPPPPLTSSSASSSSSAGSAAAPPVVEARGSALPAAAAPAMVAAPPAPVALAAGGVAQSRGRFTVVQPSPEVTSMLETRRAGGGASSSSSAPSSSAAAAAAAVAAPRFSESSEASVLSHQEERELREVSVSRGRKYHRRSALRSAASTD
jgi:hypothetical protein